MSVWFAYQRIRGAIGICPAQNTNKSHAHVIFRPMRCAACANTNLRKL